MANIYREDGGTNDRRNTTSGFRKTTKQNQNPMKIPQKVSIRKSVQFNSEQVTNPLYYYPTITQTH